MTYDSVRTSRNRLLFKVFKNLDNGASIRPHLQIPFKPRRHGPIVEHERIYFAWIWIMDLAMYPFHVKYYEVY